MPNEEIKAALKEITVEEEDEEEEEEEADA